MKKVIRLTESELCNIVKESARQLLENEVFQIKTGEDVLQYRRYENDLCQRLINTLENTLKQKPEMTVEEALPILKNCCKTPIDKQVFNKLISSQIVYMGYEWHRYYASKVEELTMKEFINTLYTIIHQNNTELKPETRDKFWKNYGEWY